MGSGRDRGSRNNPGEKAAEVRARELPLEWFGDGLVVALKIQQSFGHRVEIGEVVGREDFALGLREDEWIKHLLIVGMTGTGKTNLAFHILRELKKNAKPFIGFASG